MPESNLLGNKNARKISRGSFIIFIQTDH